MIIAGIDPGLTGAIAFLGTDATVYDMPRNMDGIDGAEVYHLLTIWQPAEVYVEHTHTMDKGARANFVQGDTRGSIRTAVHISRIPLIWVPPRKWQTEFGLFGGGFTEAERKLRSRQRAIELYPAMADQLGRVKDHNRAEALLVATFGARTSITQAVLNG